MKLYMNLEFGYLCILDVLTDEVYSVRREFDEVMYKNHKGKRTARKVFNERFVGTINQAIEQRRIYENQIN